MPKIPIFVIVHNQYEILKKSVESYEKYIKTPIEIIFHNVASVYYETLEYLKEMENKGYTVYTSIVNNHHTVINSVKDYLKKNPDCKYVIITDPDIELFNVNGDILDLYIYALNTLKKTSAGPMLEINNIPDSYYNKNAAIKGHRDQFWKKPRKNILFNNNNYQYIECNTDTTFQIFSAKNIPPSFPHSNSIRFLAPYSAKHLDWYVDANNITPCQLFCNLNSTKISHWNSNKWSGKYHGIEVNTINSKFKIKHQYIYYYNKCKCKNNYNFGDYITPYIYRKIAGYRPKHDIDGDKGKHDVVFGAGSILESCKKNSIIWGTGLMNVQKKIIKPKKILSVRGPLTREILLKNGFDCPENYGDIGLILPYFFYPSIVKKYKIGIIPHYVDFNEINNIFKNEESDIKIIDVTNHIEKVITDILECELTISSSLHGIIVSHAYNIPCMWIKVSDNVGGGSFKYRDYYGSINIENYTELNPFVVNEKLSTDQLIKLINEYPNPSFPINTKHILELCPFITIKKT